MGSLGNKLASAVGSCNFRPRASKIWTIWSRMSFTDAQIEEEQRHFANVVSTFQQYAPYAVRRALKVRVLTRLNDGPQLNANNRRRKDIHTLPLADRELIKSLRYKERISATDHAILKNAEFLNLVIANPEIFEPGGLNDLDYVPELKGNDRGHSGGDQRDLTAAPSHSRSASAQHF